MPFVSSLSVAGLIAITCLISFAVLHEWRLQQLHWRHLTANNCRRYLVPKGWRDGGGESSLRLDKPPFSILIICMLADPATIDAVQLAVIEHATHGRITVVLVPGAIAPGVAETILTRQAIVIPYRRLAALEAILRETQDSIAASHAAENRSRTEPSFAPNPAPLLPARDTPASSAPSQMIAETDQVQCTLRDHGTDTLVISFNDSWHVSEGTHLRCGPMAQGAGFSIIDVTTRAPNWFPADDMAALVPAILARVEGRFPRRVTIGFSQGGYGAIKFSRALHATTVIAFSPQVSIDPRAVGSGRFSTHFDYARNSGMGITAADCAGTTYVFYDPYDEQDRFHAAALAKLIPINGIKMPFSGHATYRLFATPDRLRATLQSCQANDTTGMIKLVASQRHNNPARALLMATYLAAPKPALAIRISQSYAPGWAVGQRAALYYHLAATGSAGVVLPWIEALAVTHPDHAEIQGCAALVAIRAKRPEAAARFVARARTIDPANAKWKHVEASARTLLLNA